MTGDATLFVLDDDAAVRRSLASLARAHGLAVETYASTEAFLSAWDPSRPGVLLLDVRLKDGKNGLDLQDRLRRGGHTLPIIVMTGHGDVPTSVRAFRAGAVDFLEKPVVPRRLLQHVRDALARDLERRTQTQAREAVARRMARLTARERQVAELMVTGTRSKEVAAALGISPRTAEGHRRRVLEKMQVSSTAELATAWLTNRSSSPR